ncbi:class I SAM-dependent methyltransferase [Mycobacterium gordonae]|uniref:class I SAM-dependent methyltransferase n=1 Tax=Mycobacterium gordonae TaxID=1778 RepID=UPI000A8C0AB5|nr:class I SAM-dependent methyltransferase [Mycobacterium gordonae]
MNVQTERDYYTADRNTGGQKRNSIYQIWEQGGALGDSVTPSTFVPEYRSHIRSKIASLLNVDSRIISLGCGNAFIESDLVQAGYQVDAIDCQPEAVSIASQKGVHARCADFMELSAASLQQYDFVYADGFFGHLCETDAGISNALSLLHRAIAARTCVLISNDAPRGAGFSLNGRNGVASTFEAHPQVPGFWYLSREYLSSALAEEGFSVLECYYFPYSRPISGQRNRTIGLAVAR